MQTLRPYQSACVQAVFDAYQSDISRILYTMATGTGKTTTFAELTKLFRQFYQFKVLVLAHRRELITQAYSRIAEHCDLNAWQIGIELAETTAPPCCEVVVGSVQTVIGGHRLPDWTPDVIIYDEAHRAGAPTYKRIYERFKERNPGLLLIGCTATAKRTDKQSLYAEKPDGTPVELWDKKKKRRYFATPEECIFEKLCFEFNILDAIEEGWIVPVVGHTVRTETDLSGVESKVNADSGQMDFVQSQLTKAIDNNERTLLAINAWKEIASDRPTLVFCAGVEHAYHAAELWKQAGYTAAALDGETDNAERYQTLEAFREGRLQVLCNMGLFTEGTDLPSCAAIVHLRPTKSWNLYCQMTGRGTRPLSGTVDAHEEAEARKAAIAASGKPDCLVIDLVDLVESHDLCAAPSLLDLPATLDLQGVSVTEAKKLLDLFEEVRDRVIGECPTTYQELKVRLQQVDMLRESNARSQKDWLITPEGFRFQRCPPGYQAELVRTGAESYELVVSTPNQVLLRKSGKPGSELKAYLDHAAKRAGDAIEQHKASLPAVSRGTLLRLTWKQANVLRRHGHGNSEIDSMPYAKARALIAQYMDAYRAQQEAQQFVEV